MTQRDPLPLYIDGRHTAAASGETFAVVNPFDGSLFPLVPTGNLNAPTIMLAEKIADRIRGRGPLPRSDAQYYVSNGAPARGKPQRRME